MSFERQEQEVVVFANQSSLPVPAAAGCPASARIDADWLWDLRAPPLNYQTPLRPDNHVQACE